MAFLFSSFISATPFLSVVASPRKSAGLSYWLSPTSALRCFGSGPAAPKWVMVFYRQQDVSCERLYCRVHKRAGSTVYARLWVFMALLVFERAIIFTSSLLKNDTARCRIYSNME